MYQQDPDQATHDTFSNLAASTDAQAKFFSSLISFMENYSFDGVDIDWEYPVASERSGKKEDYANTVTFLENLRKALGSSGHKYGLSSKSRSIHLSVVDESSQTVAFVVFLVSRDESCLIASAAPRLWGGPKIKILNNVFFW